jgi:hypothetical protein
MGAFHFDLKVPFDQINTSHPTNLVLWIKVKMFLKKITQNYRKIQSKHVFWSCNCVASRWIL